MANLINNPTKNIYYTYEDNNVLYNDVLVKSEEDTGYFTNYDGIISSYLTYDIVNGEIDNNKFLNAIDIYWCNPQIKNTVSSTVNMNIFTTGDLLKYIKDSFNINGFDTSVLNNYLGFNDFEPGTYIYDKINNLKEEINNIKAQINTLINRKLSIINSAETYVDHNDNTQFVELGRKMIDKDQLTTNDRVYYFSFISKQNNELYNDLDITVTIFDKKLKTEVYNNVYNLTNNDIGIQNESEHSGKSKNIEYDGKVLFTIDTSYNNNLWFYRVYWPGGSNNLYDYNNKKLTIEIVQKEDINNAKITYIRDFKLNEPQFEAYIAIYDIKANIPGNNGSFSIYNTENGRPTSMASYDDGTKFINRRNDSNNNGTYNDENNKIVYYPGDHNIDTSKPLVPGWETDGTTIYFYYLCTYIVNSETKYHFILVNNDVYFWCADNNDDLNDPTTEYSRFFEYKDEIEEIIGRGTLNFNATYYGDNNIWSNRYGDDKESNLEIAYLDWSINSGTAAPGGTFDKVIADNNYIEFNLRNPWRYNRYAISELLWVPGGKIVTMGIDPFSPYLFFNGNEWYFPHRIDDSYGNPYDMIWENNWLLKEEYAFEGIDNPTQLYYIVEGDTQNTYYSEFGSKQFSEYNGITTNVYSYDPIIYYELTNQNTTPGSSSNYYAFMPTIKSDHSYEYVLCSLVPFGDIKQVLFDTLTADNIVDDRYMIRKRKPEDDSTLSSIVNQGVIDINSNSITIKTHILYYFDEKHYRWYGKWGSSGTGVYGWDRNRNGKWYEYVLETPNISLNTSYGYATYDKLPGLKGYTLEDYENLIRNIIQDKGHEIIFAGHNRTSNILSDPSYYTENIKVPFSKCGELNHSISIPITQVMTTKYQKEPFVLKFG